MKKTPPTSILLSTALRDRLKTYRFATFKKDALAALVLSLIALPLSMALAIAVGLPPQHGIYTAIVAGFVVPLLGGSNWQVSGPTAAFVVILAPIVSEFGLRGIIWASLIAGMILLIMGFSKLGRLIHYIPYPVTTGFTAGIAVVLATLSLNDFLGLKIESLNGRYLEKLWTIIQHIGSFDFFVFIIGLFTLLLLFVANRIVKWIPSAVIAVLASTLLAIGFSKMGHFIPTLGSTFSYLNHEGQLLPGIPPYPPLLHFPFFTDNPLFIFPSFDEFRQLLFPAFAIAILAALESLLSAMVADSMTGTKHNPNAELNGIGIGNILSALSTGIPATGAIARTATNINNGARTPMAASIHAVLIMLYVIFFSTYINYIPMAALSAVLIHTAYRMSHYKQFINTIKIAPRSDVIVLLICFILTVFIDMVVGVGVGMICAAFLLINRVTELTQIEIEGDESEASLEVARKLPKGVMIYRIRGPLFFGTIEKAFDRYNFAHDYINQLIIDISDVPFIDMTGLVALKSMLISIAHESRQVRIVCKTEAVSQKIQQKIHDHAVKSHVHFYKTVDSAIHHLGSFAGRAKN